MDRHAEELQSKRLQLSLKSEIELIQTEIENVIEKVEFISTRPLLIQTLQMADTNRHSIAAQSALNNAAQSLSLSSKAFMKMYGKDGQELASAGIASRQPEMTLLLTGVPEHAELIWDGQLLLRVVVGMKKKGSDIGKVMMEYPLPKTVRYLKEASRQGKTGELVMCIPTATAIQCLPTALNPKVFIAPYNTPEGVPLPMSHALEGRTGYLITKDYRNQLVTAAYAPIGDYGLGMVLKMDSDELHSDVTRSLSYVISSIVILIIIALLLLRWLLSPLILQMTTSANQLRKLNTDLAFQNEEKDKRAEELILAKEDKEKRADELVLANKELAFQNEEKDKRAGELALANKELAFQNKEKDKRAGELALANKEKRKRAEELAFANKELVSQKELIQFINTANAPIFGIDAQGKINEWNLQSEKITGFSKAEVIGRNLVANFITDDYKVSVGEVLASALKGDETANYEFLLFNKSGARVDVLLNSTTRRDATGKIVGVFGVGQDITELNRIRKEQESVANDLTQLIDTANAPIFGIDAAGLVNEWNQRAELLTGFGKADVMGKDLVAGFITDDYKASVKEVLDKALKGEESANYEFPLFTKSGDRVDVLLNSTSRQDANGDIVGVVGVGQDITELKFTQAQVIQTSKLATLGEMATSVAHELNQPLNVIRMAAGNSRRKISKGTADSEYLNDKLERIENQTARAAAIIDHMRMFGRKAEEKPGLIDLREVVKNALDLMGEQLRLAGIEIVAKFPEDCSSVSGHTIQIEQVVLNLLTNARDAMAERDGKTKITLRVFEDENGVHVTSQDTGGGVPEKVLPRIFEPFYTTKEMGKGTGLGLSVSYGIIREMNGTIIAENIEDGARSTITLPAAT
jgi:PAS domain S-box-containing protein